MDRGIPNGQIGVSASQSAIENQRQEYVMTTPMDDALTAIGRQLSRLLADRPGAATKGA
jgi:hypothetical protein